MHRMAHIESVRGKAGDVSYFGYKSLQGYMALQVRPEGSASLDASDTPSGHFYAKDRTQRKPIYYAGQEDAVLSGVQRSQQIRGYRPAEISQPLLDQERNRRKRESASHNQQRQAETDL